MLWNITLANQIVEKSLNYIDLTDKYLMIVSGFMLVKIDKL